MRTKTINLYQYDELSESAKDKAREWFAAGATVNQDAWENIQEDASQIGLKITALDDRRSNKGEFLSSAEETADKIVENHGDTCETHKTASAYLGARDTLVNEAERDENGELTDEYQLDKDLDALDAEFLHDLLEDYRIMLEKDIEYLYSTESIEENIRANEYEFTEDGKRA